MLKIIYPPQVSDRRKPRRPRKPRTKRPQNPPRPRPQRYMKLYLEQEGLCFYCRQPMELPHEGNITPPLPAERITIEHLYPASDMRHRKDFVVAACHACNQERGSAFHWRDFLIQKIQHHWSVR